ncbi:MAG: lysoplasmalogenase [SAR324 cluster bacterium]|nr:lysoplasmalogenase [SAR324 cluster bacterium]
MISRFGLLLSLLILISAFAEINAERKHNARKVYLFKPLTMLLILVLAWIQGVPSSGMYSLLIFIGLILSLGGDVALMWPKDRFLVGLVFFLMAHVSYIGAFFNGIPFLSLSLIVFGLLHSRLVKVKKTQCSYTVWFWESWHGLPGKGIWSIKDF